MHIKAFTVLFCFYLFAPLTSLASDYASEHRRNIKALSDADVSGLLNGHGMGMALAAELNGYPGPKHVLELADQLALTDEQTKATRAIYERMKARAVKLGKRLVEHERQLDQGFRSRSITEAKLRDALDEIAELRAAIRFEHLRAHLDQTALLSEQQVRVYTEARGYRGHGHHHNPAGH